MQIDVYDYIASNDYRKAKQLIENYGYRCTSPNMAQNLRVLVQMEGDGVVHDLMKIHPDFEYFSDAFSGKNKSSKRKFDGFESEKFAYLNAIGSNNNQLNQSHALSAQTNVFILASALLLAAAIIIKK